MGFKIDWGLLAALAVPLVALLPLLLFRGLPNTADGPVHLMRQVELNQAWAEGNFYPRWGADLALGHGMPIFSYAPPLLYQLTQLIHLTGLPLDESMKGVIVLDFLLYSAGMFLFARRVYGPYPALVAAAVYVYAPYRLREAYIQGNYGQFSGLAFYPLIFWAFHGLITQGRTRYRVAAPLALAGLLFSHNISFMLFAPVFAAYLLFLIGLTARARHRPAAGQKSSTLVSQLSTLTRRTVVAGLLGLGLAAIFWLPAFGERHDIKLEGITQGFFDFRENFISLPEFLSLPARLDLSAINPEFPLSLGPAQMLGAALGLLAIGIAIKRIASQRASEKASQQQNESANQLRATRHPPPAIRHSQFAHSLFFVAALGLYGFLALPASQGVWEVVPLLKLTEFPWRMLGPAVFCAAALSATGWSLILHFTFYASGRTPQSQPATQHATRNTPAIPLLTLAAVLIVIGLNLPYLYPSQFIRWGTPTPADAFAYEVTSGAIGTTSTGEFLPRWAKQHPRPDTLWPDYAAGRPPQLLDPATLPPGAAATTLQHRAESDAVRISTPQKFTATLRRLYWPGWQVYVNGQPVPFQITPQTGLIQTTIPAGEHTLQLRLESTPLRAAGLWLSLAALAGLVVVSVATWRRNRTTDTGDASSARHSPDAAPSVALFVGLTALLIGFYLLTRPLQPLFVLQSNPDQPRPADRIVRVDFADQLRLVGVDNWPDVIELNPTGETGLTVVLFWRVRQKLDTNYSVFLHLDAPNGQTFATVDEVNPEDIPTRNWPPGLYLRNPLTLRLPADLPPIRYTLTTGVYNRATGRRLALAGRPETTFALGPVWLTRPPVAAIPKAVATFGDGIELHQAELDGNTLRLLWQTEQPIAENYSIFVHVLDGEGHLLAQADGVPFDGLYPLPNWRPGQPLTDERGLDLPAGTHAVTVGVYQPTTNQRLPARDPAGQPLPNDSFTVAVSQ